MGGAVIGSKLALVLAISCAALACGRTHVEPTPIEIDPLFVAVGSNGKLLISFDGMVWTERQSGVSAHLSAVAAGPSGFVAVGDGGVIVHSPDGLVWQQAASPTPYALRDVIYARDRFIAVGEDWTAGAVALTSTDGAAWTALDGISNQMFHAVAYGTSTWIAAAYLRSDLQTPSQFHRSPEGPWVQRTGPDFYTSLLARGTIVVTGGASSVSSSTDDGATWETHALGTTALIAGLAFDGTTFVAVGELGAIFSSPDARSWTKRENPLGVQGSSTAAAYGAGRFVAIGAEDRVLTSVDGIDWAANVMLTSEPLSDVAYSFSR